MKLNLGCGTFAFPLDREHIPNAEHVEPLPDTVFEPGWVNVDKWPGPGVQEAIDLFRFPWVRSSNGNPFNDGSVDEIWAAHLLEHIPHQVKAYRGAGSELVARFGRMVDELDGFFVFMAECWRVLKPDGLMHVRFPYAASYAALTDPTHTRYLTPGTFAYLSGPEPGAPFDYRVPAHFEMAEPFILRMSERWSLESRRYTAEGWGDFCRENFAAVDEVRMKLRCVKGESR